MRGRALGLLGSIGIAGTLILAACGSAAPAGGGTGGGTGGTAQTTGGTTVGAAATGGSGSATNCSPGSAIKSDGGWTMVCLKYNEQVFGVSGAACAGAAQQCGFDQGGNTLDPTDPAWPKENTEVTASGVKFWFPPTGGGKTAVKSAINVGPEMGGTVSVPVPAGKYKSLGLLAGAGNSNSSQMLDITYMYSDGSKDQTQQNIDDWCNTSPVGQPGYVPADRWNNAGAPTTPNCGVFTYVVPIPGSSKTLKSITLVDDSANATNFEPEILALSLQQA